MEYKRLGFEGPMISRIGFGSWAISGHGYGKVTDRESIDAIRKALAKGINFFDTADVYGFGHSEEILSKALGRERKRVIIATKFGVAWDTNGRTYKDCSPKRIIKALENSLRRLKIDYIPLYQIHWYDNMTPISETMNTLKKCQKEGKIQYIGCSNFSSKLILEALKINHFNSIQTQFSVIERGGEDDFFHFSNESDMGIIAYGVLARGLLSGKYSLESKFGEKDTRNKDKNFLGVRFEKNLQVVEELKRIGLHYNKAPSQVAIRWVLEHENITCTLVGAKNPWQVEYNSQVFDWKLTPEDFYHISSLTELIT